MRENPAPARDRRGAARRAARDHSVGDRQKLIGLAHVRFRNGGSWSLFRCPTCARRANRLWLIEDRPLCRHCCEGMGIVHRSKWGFGRHERLRARDQKLDELIAKLDATTGPLRFNPAPQHWRGRARLVSNSRALTMRMRRAMIVCRLNQLASQQAAKQGDDGLLRAYQPRADAARAIDIKPIWRARTSEQLQASPRSRSIRCLRSSRLKRSSTTIGRSKTVLADPASPRARLVTTAKRTAKRRGKSRPLCGTRSGYFGQAKTPLHTPVVGRTPKGGPAPSPAPKLNHTQRCNI